MRKLFGRGGQQDFGEDYEGEQLEELEYDVIYDDEPEYYESEREEYGEEAEYIESEYREEERGEYAVGPEYRESEREEYGEEAEYIESEYREEERGEYAAGPEYRESEREEYDEEAEYIASEYREEERGEYAAGPEYRESEREEYGEEAEYIESEYREEERGEYAVGPEYRESEREEYDEEAEYIESEYREEEYGEYAAEPEYLEAVSEEYPEEPGYGESVRRGGRDGYRQNRFDDERGERSGGNVFASLWQTVCGMGIMDRVIAGAGILVLLLVIAAGGAYFSSRERSRQLEEFVSVGRQLDGISLIGDSGLMAMADAQIARLAATTVIAGVEEPKKDYNEADYSKDVTVSLDMVSVVKDLKIKFTNKSSGKLIANVPFAVTVTDAGGKSVTWTDDDMDGIIYQTDMTPGSYKVTLNNLTDGKYAAFTLPSSAQSVEVKKDVAYQKVDVSNEVKKESQVNAAKEDTKKNETKVESALTDTVPWVESTSGTVVYTEVSKSSIPDPLLLVKSGSFLRIAEGTPVSGVTVSGGNAAAVTLDQTSATVYLNTPLTLGVAVTGVMDGGLTAASSDEGIATVSVDGQTVTVTGVSPGSATITVSMVSGGAEQRAACAVVVKAHPRDDRTTLLKDGSGNQLFVSEDNVYREAVYADYYTADKFFVKTGTKYTGWQTLDGKVYYFDASGQAVTGEQVIQGAKYNFASDGTLVTGSGTMGIDVSKHNGKIDWNAVKNSGVSYVIIRCGYRGSSQGSLIEDPMFVTNIKGATAAGLKVGIYFFTQAVNVTEAVEEASMVLGQISGYPISYPVFLDVEPSGGRGDKLDKSTRTEICRAFCATIQNSGYTAGIYANKTWLTEKIDVGELSAYKIWLAQYAAEPTYRGRYDMWQYKSTGRVSGISGNVDMNISYLGY